MDLNKPFFYPVLYTSTSGTTGLPKAMLHGCGSLMPTTKDFWLQFDSTRESIWFSMSPVGWVSWNMLSTLKTQITNLFLPANVVDDIEKLSYFPTKEHSLDSVKVAIAGGSVVKPQAYDLMYNKIKKDILFSATYGCTELIGTCINMEPSLPIYRGESPVPSLGIDIQCLDESGKPIEGEYGELVIAKPSPILLLGLWKDEDGSLRRKTYYSKFPGKFALGDFAIINPITKGFVICGRSDDTLKQRGTRFGSSEIYHVVDMFYEVRDSLCVSQYNTNFDERAVLFLKMRQGYPFNSELVERIQKVITQELTSNHIPEVILETQDIPYNVNGKKMEIIVKNIINKRPYNPDNVINSECLKNFEDIPDLQNF
ncbi:acetoacetyl-CoA synthetase [Trichonephila clavata]|uniref:Acetoacetyl-CoA synthetase n=1 Tax=Trichonephila clavata TaxID=2740835 RepID=A0A8X6HCN4_TRICU|nr:acetoacetyl-CoA synthetase [Trichonephila clavata]